MAAKKHTHIAVHTIQSQDEKLGTVEIKAGQGFTPADEEQEKALLKSGAIRKAKKEDLERLAATEVTKDRSGAADSNAPAGYASGTASAAEEPGLKGDENVREDAEPAASTGARTPATGARGSGGTRGNT